MSKTKIKRDISTKTTDIDLSIFVHSIFIIINLVVRERNLYTPFPDIFKNKFRIVYQVINTPHSNGMFNLLSIFLSNNRTVNPNI